MEVFWVIVVIGLIAWAIFTQVGGRKQLELEVPTSEQVAAEAVATSFSAIWTRVQGEGDLNYRPKLRKNPPTISIKFTPQGTSRCEVSIWTSRFTIRYGMMWHAQLAWRKKRNVAARLAGSLAATMN